MNEVCSVSRREMERHIFWAIKASHAEISADLFNAIVSAALGCAMGEGIEVTE